MPDRRSVDERTIEELEEILAIRKREARLARLQRLRDEGRVVEVPEVDEPPVAAPLDRTARPSTPSYYHGDDLVDKDRRWHFNFKPRRSAVKTWRDRLLLLIEIGAVVGLIFVIVSME